MTDTGPRLVYWWCITGTNIDIDDAISTDRVVISDDTDFGTVLAHRRLTEPSFVLMRSSDPIDVHDQAGLITANLGALADDLEAGAIAVFARNHLTVRRLPLRR